MKEHSPKDLAALEQAFTECAVGHANAILKNHKDAHNRSKNVFISIDSIRKPTLDQDLKKLGAAFFLYLVAIDELGEEE